MIRVGTAGWSYPDWEGRVYPRKKPRSFHPLNYLARYFDCVEINSTFYAQPNPRYAESWVERVEERPEFRFTAKLLQRFTHAPPGPEDELRREAATFLRGLDPLITSGRLTALLVQFPWSFRRSPEACARLQRIEEWFGGQTLVLELRHSTWFGEESLAELRRSRYRLAWIDAPASRDSAPREFDPGSGLGYVRLHGRNQETWFDPKAGRDQRYDYLYAEREVREMAHRIRRLAGDRDETYVITNNHFGGQAVANALELLAELRDPAERPLAPATILEAYPRLAARVRAEGQGRLFGPDS